jgi:hypothetical protein
MNSLAFYLYIKSAIIPIMNKKIKLTISIISYIYFPGFAQSQSWEVYDDQIQLQARLIYDKIEILGENVRIGIKENVLYLLSPDLKPSLTLEGNSVYQYLEPWILVKGEKGIGAYHEYGQLVLPLEYDEIQTYINLLLAKKGDSYWLYERGKNKIKSLGQYDEAKLTKIGVLITKIGEEYFLPLSQNPEKPYDLLQENEGNYLLAREPSGYGLVNRDGEYVLDPILEKLEPTRGNFYFGYDEKQYLLIEGNEIQSNIKYNSFHEITYRDGMMLEYIHGKLRRIMEEDGILLDAVGMEEVKMVGKDLYNVRFRDGKIGLAGKTGWLVQPMSGVERIDFGTEGLFPAQIKGLTGFVNQAGNWVIPAQFSEVSNFSEKIASFKNTSTWGLINATGEIISAPTWDEVKPFTKGISIAQNSGKSFLINTAGEPIQTAGFEKILRTSDGYFLVEKEGKAGLIDPKGNQILPAEFDNIRREKKDFIVVNKGGLSGVVNESGEIVLPLAYPEILVDWTNNQILTKNTYEPVLIQEIKSTTKKNKKGA